jgi:alpha-galactosidase
MGRLCLSGELDELDEKQWSLVREIVRFYDQVALIIKNGRSRLYQDIGLSWQHPQGTQAVLRTSTDNSQALLVAHSFANPLSSEIVVELPQGNWHVAGILPGANTNVKITGNQLGVQFAGEFEGYVVHLENNKCALPAE